MIPRHLVQIAAIAGMVFAASLAMGQGTTDLPAPDTTVVFPWGEYVSVIASWVLTASGSIAALVIAWVAKVLGDRWTAVTKIAQVEQLLKRAIEYAANTTAGVTKGKVIKVDVANEFLKQAIQFAIDSAPKWMIAFMGGEAGIRAKLIARAEFEANATAADLNAPPPTIEAKAAVAESKEATIK